MNLINKKKIYVATHTEIEDKPENVICMSWNITQQILEEQKLPWKNIYLWGGAVTTDDFIKSDIIDEYIIGIIPTILWKWRQLFLDNNPTIKLHLLQITNQEWIVIWKYEKK